MGLLPLKRLLNHIFKEVLSSVDPFQDIYTTACLDVIQDDGRLFIHHSPGIKQMEKRGAD